MNANFDMNALGAFIALYQQNIKKEEAKVEDEITMENLSQFMTVFGENTNKTLVSEQIEFLSLMGNFMSGLENMLKFANKIQRKYNFDIDDLE